MGLHRVSTTIVIVSDVGVVEIFHNPIEPAVGIVDRRGGHDRPVDALSISLLIWRGKTVECNVTRSTGRVDGVPFQPPVMHA